LISDIDIGVRTQNEAGYEIEVKVRGVIGDEDEDKDESPQAIQKKSG
jgi:hypothetical protein